MFNIPFLTSLAIHVIVILVFSFGIKNPFASKAIQDKGYTVFDFVEIGPKSKAPVLSEKEGKVSKTKSQTKENEIVQAKDQPEESSASSEKKKEEKSISNEKEIKEEKTVNDKKSINIKKDKKKEKPKKQPKKSSKAKESKKKDDSSKASEKAFVNLRKNKKERSKSDPNAAKKSFDSLLDDATASSDNENSGIKAEEVGFSITATEIDLVRQTIRKCWHLPAGLKNAEELIVDIRMEVAKDGTVTKAEIVDKDRMKSDPNFKIAAENAYRAVLDPECNPLPLPLDKYEEWKEIEFSFNPAEMFK